MSRPTHVVSVSGGKDSQATGTLCIERHGNAEVLFAFAETDNEHELTYAHLDYLEQLWRRPIRRVRADFTAELARKRQFILTQWPLKGVPLDIVERASKACVPSGNAFLDLCVWKGCFPSRMAQFCTQLLKRHTLDKLMVELALRPTTSLDDLHSWQGVRRDESERRKNALERERAAEGWWIERPIVEWTAQQTVDFCLSRGQRLNPLYSRGMKRVGCMVCINCTKDELNEVDKRFPHHIDKIRRWEGLVGEASKRGYASFFTMRKEDEDETADEIFERANIDEKIRWSRTSRGGRQFDLLRMAPAPECSSSYGLCE